MYKCLRIIYLTRYLSIVIFIECKPLKNTGLHSFSFVYNRKEVYEMTTIVKDYPEINLYDLSSYQSAKDMDIAANEMNKYLNAKEYALLNFIRQKSSVRSIGVVSLLHKTIGDNLQWSVSTVKRYIKRLVNKGALVIENSIRPVSKGYGACIYIVPSLAHFNKTYKAYVSRQRELSELTYRKQHLKRRQSQQAKAFAYVSLKKRTMNINSYTLNLLSTTSNSDDVSNKDNYKNRQNNIKNAKIKPNGLPAELWEQFKPFFTDQQLLRLYKVMLKEVKDFTYGANALDQTEILEVMINALNSLVRAMRKEQRGGSKVYNIFSYAKSVAYSSAFNLSEYDTLDRFIEPAPTSFSLNIGSM